MDERPGDHGARAWLMMHKVVILGSWQGCMAREQLRRHLGSCRWYLCWILVKTCILSWIINYVFKGMPMIVCWLQGRFISCPIINVVQWQSHCTLLRNNVQRVYTMNTIVKVAQPCACGFRQPCALWATLYAVVSTCHVGPTSLTGSWWWAQIFCSGA